MRFHHFGLFGFEGTLEALIQLVELQQAQNHALWFGIEKSHYPSIPMPGAACWVSHEASLFKMPGRDGFCRKPARCHIRELL